jgi:glycosyltransferase involved in cell wall biosynthesis
MKVLYATYPWAFETPGGGEIQLLKYEQYLKASDLDIVRHDPWVGGLVHADIVHFFSCMGGSLHFCNYVKDKGKPLVISASLWLTEKTKNDYPVGEIAAQLALADKIIVNGDVEAEQLAAVLHLKREKFITVRNACDPVFTAPADPLLFRKRFGVSEPFLLNVGNIEPRKNQLNLIRASRSLNIDLIVVGHVRDADYAARCREEGGDRFRYLGALDHEDPLLRSAYVACAVFCLPSTLETPGLAAIEAAAAGARLVITEVGSAREYFGGDAYYVASYDVIDMAAKIKCALAEPVNPGLRKRMAERFTWVDTVKPLAELYRSLAAGPGRSR